MLFFSIGAIGLIDAVALHSIEVFIVRDVRLRPKRIAMRRFELSSILLGKPDGQVQ